MNGLHVTCENCHRSWRLDTGDSVYLQLELVSRPCPYCEACTLNCHQVDDAGPTPRPSRARRPNPSLSQDKVAPATGPG